MVGLSGNAQPVPFFVAAYILAKWVTAEERKTEETASRATVRVRVRPGGFLPWLRAQKLKEKLYFRCREDTFEVAAVGFIHRAQGECLKEEEHAALAAILNPKHPAMKIYGALRFDDGFQGHSSKTRIDSQWEPYGGFLFVLPAVELYRTADDEVYLAVNMLRLDDRAKLLQILRSLLPTPSSLLTSSPSLMIPRAIDVQNIIDFETWDLSMKRILFHLRSRKYNKIVLARGKRFCFSSWAKQDVVQILAALDESNAKGIHESRNATESASIRSLDPELSERQNNASSSYLFCLQLDDQQGFLGCSPERLFRLQGSQILTNAIAGTVRRDSTCEDAVLKELWGAKNSSEHNFVVDYIKSALRNLGASVHTSPTTVLPLPRLMHLYTKIVGHFANDILPANKLSSDFTCTNTPSDDERTNVSSKSSEARTLDNRKHASRLYRLLRTIHPTPAVCGVPQRVTIDELSVLENFDRGLFAGPFGWFSKDSSEFCVAIRSALVSGDTVTAYAGSGIVVGSESHAEWDETELKMSAFTDLFTKNRSCRSLGVEGKEQFCARSTGKSIESEAESVKRNDPDSHGPLDPSIKCTSHPGSKVLQNIEMQQRGSSKTLRSSFPGQFSKRGPGSNGLPLENGIPETFNRLNMFSCSRLECEPNLNALWGSATIEELCRNGIDTFFVAPGSRSAPLAVGVFRSPYAHMFLAHDERGAGFLALGYGRATRRAAAVITSSGTAVANLMPAIVEAFMDNIPILLLTADRPPELRDVGANQAIDQVKIFGGYARWFLDVPCPSDEIHLRKLLSDIDHAVERTGSVFKNFAKLSIGEDAGPVHINFMFRENLAPDHQDWNRKCLEGLSPRWTQSLNPLTVTCRNPDYPQIIEGNDSKASAWTECQEFLDCVSCLSPSRYGVILIGGGPGLPQNEEDRLSISLLANALGWPVIADITSGMRLDDSVSNLIAYADQLLLLDEGRSLLQSDAILQFGERLISKRVLRLISDLGEKGRLTHIQVVARTSRSDQMSTVTHRVFSSPSCFVLRWLRTGESTVGLADLLPSNHDSALCTSQQVDAQQSLPNMTDSRLMKLICMSTCIDGLLSELTTKSEHGGLQEPLLARSLVMSLSYPCALYIGNSMPIRDLDMYAPLLQFGSKIHIGANRGASGIDGLLSSGIGFGLGLGLRSIIFLGDMSLIHDLNALHILDQSVQVQSGNIPPVTIVVVNNRGGGIFSMLPIARHKALFSPTFSTPHSLSFALIAEAFGLEYHAVRTTADMRTLLSRPACRHRLLEAFIAGSHSDNADLHRQIQESIRERLLKM